MALSIIQVRVDDKLTTEAIELYEKLGIDRLCCTYSNELNRRIAMQETNR